MPYAPLGFQTPIPPAGTDLWDDPRNRRPGYYPNTELRNPAIAAYPMARQPLEPTREFFDRQTGDVVPHVANAVLAGPLSLAAKLAPVGTRALMDYVLGITPAYGAEPTAEQKANPKFNQKLFDLQTDMASRGIYKKTPDGLPGGETDRARAIYDQQLKDEAAQKAEQGRQELEAKKLELENKKQTAAETAATQAAELKGQQTEAGRAAQKRYEEIGKPTTWDVVAPYAGGAAGAAEAILAQLALGKTMSRGARQTTAEGERVIQTMGGGRVPSGDVPTRVGRVQEYADIGGAKQMPFSPIQTPGAPEQYPWTPNPQATPFNKLYRPGLVANFGPGAVSGGLAAAEYGYGTNTLENARAERLQAEKDYAELAQRGATGPEYENALQRLQKARIDEAKGTFFERMGQGAGVGTGIMGAKQYIAGGRTLPQGSGRMEAERGRLNAILNQQGGAAPLSPAGPGPLPLAPGPAPLALPAPAAQRPPPAPGKQWVFRPGGPGGGGRWIEEDAP